MPEAGLLVVVLIVALVIFGPKKLGDVGSALGRSVRGFRTEVNADSDDAPGMPVDGRAADVPTLSQPAADAGVLRCGSCTGQLRSGDKFCMYCGLPVAGPPTNV